MNYGIDIPKAMREDIGYAVKDVSDEMHKELSPQEVYDIFKSRYLKYDPVFKIDGVHFVQEDNNEITAKVNIVHNGKATEVAEKGNGRLNAVAKALESYFNTSCNVTLYEEDALANGSDSSAIAYVGVSDDKDRVFFGAGIDPDIMRASIDALESAVNRQLEN